MNNIKSKLNKLFISLISIFCIFLTKNIVYADNIEDDVKQALEAYRDYLEKYEFYLAPFRAFEWWLLKSLSYLNNFLEKTLYDSISFLNITKNEKVMAIVLSPVSLSLVTGLAFIMLLYSFYQYFFADKVINFGVVAGGIATLIVVLGIFSSRVLTNTDFGELSLTQNNAQNQNGLTKSEQLLRNNIVDLDYLDDKFQFNPSNASQINNSSTFNYLDTPDKLKYLDINDIRNDDHSKKPRDENNGYSDLGSKVLKSYSPAPGEYDEFRDSFTDIGDGAYFRYTFSFWIPLITLVCSAFVYAMMAFKVFNLLYEIISSIIILLPTIAFDIGTGERRRLLITHIIGAILIIPIMFVSLEIYYYVMEQVNAADISVVTKMIAVIALSLSVVDGPNIYEKLFGFDAGLKSGWGMVTRTMAGVSLAKGVSSMAGSVTGGAVGGVKAGVKGAKAGFNYARDKFGGSSNSTKADTSHISKAAGGNNSSGKFKFASSSSSKSNLMTEGAEKDKISIPKNKNEPKIQQKNQSNSLPKSGTNNWRIPQSNPSQTPNRASTIPMPSLGNYPGIAPNRASTIPMPSLGNYPGIAPNRASTIPMPSLGNYPGIAPNRASTIPMPSLGNYPGIVPNRASTIPMPSLGNYPGITSNRASTIPMPSLGNYPGITPNRASTIPMPSLGNYPGIAPNKASTIPMPSLGNYPGIALNKASTIPMPSLGNYPGIAPQRPSQILMPLPGEYRGIKFTAQHEKSNIKTKLESINKKKKLK